MQVFWVQVRIDRGTGEKKRARAGTSILDGLDEEAYGAVRSNILSTEPLPNLNKVYAMIVQQERVRTVTRGKKDSGTPVGFSVQAHPRSDSKDKAVVCGHCNRPDHEETNCFQLVWLSRVVGRKTSDSRQRNRTRLRIWSRLGTRTQAVPRKRCSSRKNLCSEPTSDK